MYPPGFPQPTTGSVDGTALTRGWELIVKKPWWFASISAGSSRFVSGDIKSSHQGVRSTCTSRAGDCRNSTQLQCVILTVVGCNLPNISSFMTKTYKAADPWLLHAVYEHVYPHSTWDNTQHSFSHLPDEDCKILTRDVLQIRCPSWHNASEICIMWNVN